MSNAKSLSNLNRGPIGNQHAAKHGARRETFSRHEADEISEITDLIREITPWPAPASRSRSRAWPSKFGGGTAWSMT